MADTSQLPQLDTRDGLFHLDVQERGLRPPPGYGFWRRMWWWFDFLILVKLARLRFIAVLVAVGAVIAYWDRFVVYYEKWTRPATEEVAAEPDTEFWCPMHPTIVRAHPDKCPICGMPLSKHKKGEKTAEALPPGVVSRVQLTPYRVILAGVQTTQVEAQLLHRHLSAVGFVEYDERRLARITARVSGKSRIDKLYADVTGQFVKKGDPLVELYSPDLVVTVQNLLDARNLANPELETLARKRLELWGIDAAQIQEILRTRKPITHLTIRSPMSGYVLRKYQVEGEYIEEGSRLYDVADLSSVWVEAQIYEDEVASVKQGMEVEVTTRAFPNRIFRGRVNFIYPFLDITTRTLKVRFDVDNADLALRRGMYATVTVKIPVTRRGLLAAQGETARGAAATVALAAHVPFALSPARLDADLATIVQTALEIVQDSASSILTVPEQSVIDTGNRTLVYREVSPDIYDAVEVRLGPRCGAYYPVLEGLEAGDHVVTTGSFLLDAETRLTAGAGSTYFGASSGPQGDRPSTVTSAHPSRKPDQTTTVANSLARLSAEDRRLAVEQGVCPVLGTPLGKMGVPVKVMIKGEPVLLCCSGCRPRALEHAEQTLAKAKELKSRNKGSSQQTEKSTTPGEIQDPVVLKNMALLSPADRKAAEEQRYCAAFQDKLLGTMGPPVKVMVKGKAVFTCCEGCESALREDPESTLKIVEQLKAKTAAERVKKGGRR